ncbi:hypothetical protein DO97_09335 [Neosynechococcus sphagnicola sy1]|uniref:UPF0102 protein DO97_09335 n=1 Tax=Neosynechococcus sphagnicola sy1 TaxID=1497020 RepID=A0A098TJH5_9CYAN|nr:YraN family protein [Neosynechococcus sphagnicola]KGF72306.1 hypothetical protein DO97_09335 [Neosynechococcus sphagnicola sy1]
MGNRNSYYPDIGAQGEDFVAQWLEAQGWLILYRRWRCRWGELDLVAHYRGEEVQTPRAAALAFVEVKTRSASNWDADGLLAITAAKQAKLWQAARQFLAEHPYLSDLPCRFDVALVRCQRPVKDLRPGTPVPPSQFQLHEYIPGAFDNGA